MGVPPHWNSLRDRRRTSTRRAKKAESLGAKVLMPPFDVMDAGRMAVLQDPTGAVFQIWQAKRSIGAKILNEPGALCWTELTTTRHEGRRSVLHRAVRLDAEAQRAPASPMEYTEFSVDGTPSIGMMAKPPQMPAHMPSYWMPYFQVANCDASTAKAKELGGNGDGRRRRTFRTPAASPSSATRRARCSPSSSSRRQNSRCHMMFRRKPLTIPSKADALPGRAERDAGADAHFVNGHRIVAAVSRRPRARHVRHGLLLGRGEEVLAAAAASTAPRSATPAARRRTRPIAKSAPA